MEYGEIIDIVIKALGWLFFVGMAIYNIIKTIKDGKWSELRALLEEQLIPLMEQAESMFDDAEEKENWVLEKLRQKTHFDFYKHKKILALAKDIISKICQATKIEVNKTIVKQEKLEQSEGENNDTYL